MAVLVATAQSVKSALARLLIGMAGVYTLQSLVEGLMNAGLPTFLRNQGLGLDAIGLISPFSINRYADWGSSGNNQRYAGGVFWISSKFCHSSYRFCHLTRFIYSTFKQNSP